jgi:FtsP/CotA-like multicopper oxidase with cupredoxin domain
MDKGLNTCKDNDITNIDLTKWVFYTDLSTKTDDQIAVRRFRPLMFAGSSLTINGHVDFHSGRSEQLIGSTSDWFLVNAFGGGHPIHVHLINFQVLKAYDLLLFQNKTTYY